MQRVIPWGKETKRLQNTLHSAADSAVNQVPLYSEDNPSDPEQTMVMMRSYWYKHTLQTYLSSSENLGDNAPESPPQLCDLGGRQLGIINPTVIVPETEALGGSSVLMFMRINAI